MTPQLKNSYLGAAATLDCRPKVHILNASTAFERVASHSCTFVDFMCEIQCQNKITCSVAVVPSCTKVYFKIINITCTHTHTHSFGHTSIDRETYDCTKHCTSHIYSHIIMCIRSMEDSCVLKCP